MEASVVRYSRAEGSTPCTCGPNVTHDVRERKLLLRKMFFAWVKTTSWHRNHRLSQTGLGAYYVQGSKQPLAKGSHPPRQGSSRMTRGQERKRRGRKKKRCAWAKDNPNAHKPPQQTGLVAHDVKEGLEQRSKQTSLNCPQTALDSTRDKNPRPSTKTAQWGRGGGGGRTPPQRASATTSPAPTGATVPTP